MTRWSGKDNKILKHLGNGLDEKAMCAHTVERQHMEICDDENLVQIQLA